jgi:hypothetical protein
LYCLNDKIAPEIKELKQNTPGHTIFMSVLNPATNSYAVEEFDLNCLGLLEIDREVSETVYDFLQLIANLLKQFDYYTDIYRNHNYSTKARLQLAQQLLNIARKLWQFGAVAKSILTPEACKFFLTYTVLSYNKMAYDHATWYMIKSHTRDDTALNIQEQALRLDIEIYQTLCMHECARKHQSILASLQAERIVSIENPKETGTLRRRKGFRLVD